MRRLNTINKGSKTWDCSGDEKHVRAVSRERLSSDHVVVIAVRATDKRIACDEEFSDSEDEGEGGRRDAANHKKGAKRPRVDEEKKDGEEKKAGW